MLVLIKGLSDSPRKKIARTLAATFGAVYLNTDRIKYQLEKSGSYTEVTTELIHAKMLTQIEKALQQERCVVVDDSFPSKAIRAPFIAVGRKYKQRMYWIVVETDPYDTTKQTCAQRTKIDPYKDMAIENLDETLEEEHLVLHPDKNDMKGMINKVWTYLDTVKEYA